jgi:hypothetical protein
MDADSRLQLQKMIKANNVEDQTDLIRELKHSHTLQLEINKLLMIKAKHRREPNKEELIHAEASNDCNFLFTHYTDIYNKVRKDEIDLSILNKFLNILRQIEDGLLDQHEGAFAVGTLLKELYVDSALRKANKLNEKEEVVQKEEGIRISWKEFKNLKR